jgi:glycosyltransferase involved in cell wall biosynthesis
MAKITAGTFVLNPLRLDYPIIEWVQNVKEFCDEVILVDMGSNDGIQRAIKRKFGKSVKVLTEVWKFEKDYHEGIPRNRIVQAAQGDWIYITDCDEIMPEWHFASFHKLLDSNPSIDMYRMSVIRFYGSCYLRLIDPGFQRPIFRNHKDLFFGPPHGKSTGSGHTLLKQEGRKATIARKCVKNGVVRHIGLHDYGKCRRAEKIAASHNFFIKQDMARTGNPQAVLFNEKTFKVEKPEIDGVKYIKWEGQHPRVMEYWLSQHWNIHGWEV